MVKNSIMSKFFIFRSGSQYLIARTPTCAVWSTDFATALLFDSAQSALDYLLPYFPLDNCYVAVCLPIRGCKVVKTITPKKTVIDKNDKLNH